MEKIEDTLTGKFLISTPNMPDKRFAEHVILICSHSEKDGTIGLAVNQHYGQVAFGEVLGGIDEVIAKSRLTEMYLGGPVEPEAGFILYECINYSMANQITVTETLAVSREKKVLEDLARGEGPRNYLFILGYTGWAPGQIEAELVRDGWLVLPSSNDIIFHMDSKKKWAAAAGQYGIDITLFDDDAGSA